MNRRLVEAAVVVQMPDALHRGCRAFPVQALDRPSHAWDLWRLGEGRAILKGVPGNTTGYGESKWDRYLRWQERLTLKQYALFIGVLTFITATLVAVLFSAVGLSQGLGFAVAFVPTMTVALTAFMTWWRWDGLRNKQEQDRRDHEPGTPGD